MIGAFLSKGGWIPVLILTVLGMGYGWHRTELARARQQGVAEERAAEADQLKASFDSAVAVHAVSEGAAVVRIARLMKDSTANLIQRQALSKAASTASQLADSILAELMDSLPQLAGVQAAIDTLTLQVAAERDGRVIAEKLAAESEARRATTNELLTRAKSVIQMQASTIAQLEKAGGTHGGGVSLLEAALVVVVGGGLFALGTAF